MVIVFNIHLGELQQLQYNSFRPKKVVVIHLFVALDNATKVSAKCNVLCCFSVIKYQLPNHQESTVKNLMTSLCKKNLIILGNSPDLFLRCLNQNRHYVPSGTTKKFEAISMDGMSEKFHSYSPMVARGRNPTNGTLVQRSLTLALWTVFPSAGEVFLIWREVSVWSFFKVKNEVVGVWNTQSTPGTLIKPMQLFPLNGDWWNMKSFVLNTGGITRLKNHPPQKQLTLLGLFIWATKKKTLTFHYAGC